MFFADAVGSSPLSFWKVIDVNFTYCTVELKVRAPVFELKEGIFEFTISKSLLKRP